MPEQACALSGAAPARSRALHDAEPIFHAAIVPNCSLTDGACRIAIGLIVAVTTIVAIAFTAHGLWPIAIFAALDGVIVAVAFVASRRSLERHEEVIVVPGLVIVRRHVRAVLVDEQCIEHLGLAVACRQDPDFGCLEVTLRRRHVSIGIARDLSPHEREEFRRAFLDALWRAGARPRVLTSCTPPAGSSGGAVSDRDWHR